MKCMVILGMLVLAFQANSTLKSTNVLLTFNTLTDYRQIEYFIETIEGSFPLLYISDLYTISFKVINELQSYYQIFLIVIESLKYPTIKHNFNIKNFSIALSIKLTLCEL